MVSNAPSVLSTIREPVPAWLASMRCTGVAKSVTLSGRCSAGDRLALPTLMTTSEPCLRMSGIAPSPLKRMISLPEPPSPRLKSMLDTARSPAMCLAGSTATGAADWATAKYDTVVAGCWACTAPKAETSPATRPSVLARRGVARRRLGRCCAWVTVILLPLSIVFERNRRRPFQPAARAIRHKFDEFDAVAMDSGHATVVLPHVHARVDPIHDLVGRHHQPDHSVATADRADHVQAVERELLERLLAPVRIRPWATARVLRRERVAERVTHALRRVFERLELLHHRERIQRRRGLGLDVGHPLLEVRRVARRAGDPAAAGAERKRQAQREHAAGDGLRHAHVSSLPRRLRHWPALRL